VDELIGIDSSTGHEKEVGRIKIKFMELTVIEELIKNENIMLMDSSVGFQEEISLLKKERKSSKRKA